MIFCIGSLAETPSLGKVATENRHSLSFQVYKCVHNRQRQVLALNAISCRRASRSVCPQFLANGCFLISQRESFIPTAPYGAHINRVCVCVSQTGPVSCQVDK